MRLFRGGGRWGRSHAARWFVAANLNGLWSEDAWRFSAKLGSLWANESKKAYTESNGVANAALSNSLGSVNLGGTVGYNLGFFEPYVGGTGRKWLGDANSKADFLAQAGTKLYLGDLAVGNIEVAAPYLSSLIAMGREAEVLDFARRNLSANDPVGLWFSGIVMLGSPEKFATGMTMMQQSLRLGVERFVEIPPEVKGQINGFTQ